MNARDLMDRADTIFFEGDVVRDWLNQLARRAKGTLQAAKDNKFFKDEWLPEYEELDAALGALRKAEEQLAIFQAAVAKRESSEA
ncbi:MAG: hypothetical protein H6729_11735 [Deltaproteobacteria bacterium]|nr:hypothetical protein [Deltaproteobacteria bacterium]